MIYLKRTLVKIYSKLVLTRQDKILFIQPQTHRCTRGHSKFTFYINTNNNLLVHNIDFHASTGALGGGALTKVAPGEEVVLPAQKPLVQLQFPSPQ
jgi:hypothetical protein